MRDWRRTNVSSSFLLSPLSHYLLNVLSRYESCSSSVSSKIDECDDSDVACACSHANTGFGYVLPLIHLLQPKQKSDTCCRCLTSYCHTQTEAVCAASYILNNFCAAVSEPGPTFTDYDCPGSLTSILASVIPTSIEAIISSNVNNIPSGVPIPFFNSNDPESAASSEGSKTTTGDSKGNSATQTGGIQAPSATSGGRLVRAGWALVFEKSSANFGVVDDFVKHCVQDVIGWGILASLIVAVFAVVL
jgi:hypothetical protein